MISGGCGRWTGFGWASRSRQDVVHAVERERLLAPMAHQHLELLLEHVHPDLRREEREPVRLVLALVPARSDAEIDPPSGHVVGGHDELGEDRRVAEARRRDERPEPQRRGCRGQRVDRAPRVERAPLGMLPVEVLVVVGAEQGRDPVLLARGRERQPLGPRDALLPFDHQADIHGMPSSIAGPRSYCNRVCIRLRDGCRPRAARNCCL